MTSQTSYGSSMLFQSINDDLNASLATADELSREFSSLLQESGPQTSSVTSREKPQSVSLPCFTSKPPTITTTMDPGGSSGSDSGGSTPYSPSQRSLDVIISGSKSLPTSPVFSTHSLTSPNVRREGHSPLPRLGSDSYAYGQRSPNQSPRTQRRNSPSQYNRSPRGSLTHMEASPSHSPTALVFDQAPRSGQLHPSPGLLTPYDSSQMGRSPSRPDRSPSQPDRSPSPRPFSHPISNTLPRNFGGFKQAEEGVQRQRQIPGTWNETDLDASFERKAHHTYDKTEWLRPSVPNSNWRESNLDGPPLTHNPKMDSLSRAHQPSHGSLPRNARISVPPDSLSPAHSPYHPQPIINRISIPPASGNPRQRKPIPLSVIMRLQNPHWAAAATRHPRILGGEGDMPPYQPSGPLPREFLHQPVHHHPQHLPPELRQPAFYGEVLNPGDIDAELERLDLVHRMSAIPETSGKSERGRSGGQGLPVAPRPLSPTRLQPVVAPEAQSQVIPDLEELLRMRAEIPRALKRRGSVEQAQPLKKASHYEPNQYKHLINKLFHRKSLRQKGDQGSENSSSSDGEDSPATPHAPFSMPMTSTPLSHDHRGYHSILRRSSREHKGSGRRARLSPLVLLLDGSLVGELDTVQRAVQEMSDPSQPNDEGITALHNAICGGHYNVVDFLVCIGANVSAPDSHGWTPLHCAASCNDRPLCEFLVRNGAAVMAVTESDGATASQKCDPYAVGFEECESFLRGVEDSMGVENSGVLYALWSYPAQAADELSFKEGDMVTILQKTEGVDWWWASLCGREGFVPNNYFGLFPKVRPKSLC
ncbi:relA-associated inhibitor isoform 2-T4 [Polymixia lowei]